MSRTLSQLAEGTIVYIDETVSGMLTHAPFIYLGLDDSGNARLLRKNTFGSGRRMNASAVANFGSSEMSTFLSSTYTGYLDEATRAALVATSVSHTYYTSSSATAPSLQTTTRKCFLMSYTELGFAATAAGSEGKSYLDALKAAFGTTAQGTAVKSDANYWLRSASSYTNYKTIGTSGTAGTASATGTSPKPRPVLAFDPSTVVSDEGAPAVFLLPQGRTTYWTCAATMRVGSSARRPKKAKLIVNMDQEFYDVTFRVSNNCQDTSPTWRTCTNGGTAVLGSTKTTADWELGVKVNAKATKDGARLYEPTLIVELE